MNITSEFKQKVVQALLERRTQFGGADKAFATQWKLHPSIWSRIKSGDIEGQIIAEHKWVELGRLLDIQTNKRKWHLAKTEVYIAIEQDALFCKEHGKAMLMVDDPEIGKTTTAKHLAATLKNCFYLDCSQAKNKTALIRKLATTIGLSDIGRISEVKENIKYYLKMLEKPLVLLDEGGDLDYGSFLELKEMWNATENTCGWYMLGAEGLETKLQKGIRAKKPGFKEFFSRYGSTYTNVVPLGKPDKINFYKKLIIDALMVNGVTDRQMLNQIVVKCLAADSSGHIGGLRRAESILLMMNSK